MRMVLPFAALLLLSANVQAQQLAEPAASTRAPALEPKLAPLPAMATVPAAPTEVKPIQTPERRAEAESATKAVAEDAVRQTVIPRGFWWLVGAVVVGGIILAVIL